MRTRGKEKERENEEGGGMKMEDEQEIPPYTGESSSLTVEASEQYQVPPPETLPLRGSQSRAYCSSQYCGKLSPSHTYIAHYITVAIILGDKTGVYISSL